MNDKQESSQLGQSALEEYKLCVTRQCATQDRIWPMASVLLIFGLGGLAIFGRESATDWDTLAAIGVAGAASVAVLWLWRMLDWNETYWQDIVHERMWRLEERLGFATNLYIHFMLLEETELQTDSYWKTLPGPEKEFVLNLLARYNWRPMRMRHTFNWIATFGTLAWVVLFSVRFVEFIASR